MDKYDAQDLLNQYARQIKLIVEKDRRNLTTVADRRKVAELHDKILQAMTKSS